MIQDGSITETIENENLISIIGSCADLALISIHDSLTPSLNNLTHLQKNDRSFPKPDSFMGMLLYLLIVLECIVLGIENFMISKKGFMASLARIISIILLLIFIVFLPYIYKSILNIFTSMGMVMSGGNTTFKRPTSDHSFVYMPSDVLYTFNICKSMLSIEHIRLGGYTLSTIIPHFFVILGEFAISIPFIILMLMVVFWYTEMFLIFTAGYIALPFSVFSKSQITSYKEILKAMLMQGVKIAIGVFLANFVKDIIIKSLEKLDGGFTSTTHTVIFAIFITIIVFFIITKGTSIILNALKGDVDNQSKNPLSFAAGVIAGSFAGLGKSINDIKKGHGSSSKTVLPDFNNNKPLVNSNKNTVPVTTNTNKENPANKNNPDNTKTISKSVQNPNSIKGYGEVNALATRDRINAARLEMQNEGIQNPKEEDVIKKAKDDAIIAKLLKMEKQNFMLEGGVFNRPAFEQLERMRNKK